MKNALGIALLTIAPIFPATAQHHSHHPAQDHPTVHTPSPYAGETGREIPALAPEEIAALLSGEGMGLARAAELRHYPGPLHVLQLASDLALTPDQKKTTEEIFGRMKEKATALGASVVEAERDLDALFKAGRIDEASLQNAVGRIADLRGQLREAHLRAHLEMKEILTPAQIATYDRLRGYTAPKS